MTTTTGAATAARAQVIDGVRATTRADAHQPDPQSATAADSPTARSLGGASRGAPGVWEPMKLMRKTVTRRRGVDGSRSSTLPRTLRTWTVMVDWSPEPPTPRRHG